jgi:DNA-binding LacI/PurR family transcriptional regulator
MTELNYVRDEAARSLRSGRVHTLGFLVVDDHPHYLADPLTDLMLAGVGDVARDRGYGVLIQGERPDRRKATLLNPLLERRVDATCIVVSGAPALRRWYVRQLVAAGSPFVAFDEPATPPGFTVTAANHMGARKLTEHLIERGHERIGFIAAHASWAVIEERHRGYLEALRQAEIAVRPELQLFEGGMDPSGGGEMLAKLLELRNPPTAVMATSDLLAAGALQTARRHRLRVPDEMAIAGFDDFDFASLLEPPLTTVRVPGYDMGRTAATLLIDQLENSEIAPHQVELSVDVRLRDST